MGVTTMKMISSTSITSTIGVTLMSELTFAPSFRFANAMEFRLLPCPYLATPPEICYRECRASPPGPYQQLMGSNQPVGPKPKVQVLRPGT